MGNKVMIVTVRGKQHEWAFHFYGNPDDMRDWRDDGLEVYVAENTVPQWAARIGAARLWAFIQDVISLRNPF